MIGVKWFLWFSDGAGGYMADSKFHDLPDGLTEEQAQIISETFRVLGAPIRVRIVFALGQNEMTVGDLSIAVDASQSSTSHHLAKLRSLRIVRSRREGLHVYYSVDDHHITNLFLEVLGHLAHNNQQVDQSIKPLL